MKPNELRIGNTLTSKTWLGYHRVDGIERIDDETFEVKTTGYVHRYEKGTWFELKPIPLTEELLLKCGFEKGEAGNFSLQWCKGFHKHKTIEIELDGGEVCSSFWIGAGADKMLLEIHSIHQLQNLFYAITGEELEINL